MISWLCLLIGSGVGAFIGAYLGKKAENLATKQGIQAITEKVEDVKTMFKKDFEIFKSSLDLKTRLKLASLDKRLQKHQEAYTLWRKVFTSVEIKGDNKNDGNFEKNSVELCEWWENNCLYLASAIFIREILSGVARGFGKTEI